MSPLSTRTALVRIGVVLAMLLLLAAAPFARDERVLTTVKSPVAGHTVVEYSVLGHDRHVVPVAGRDYLALSIEGLGFLSMSESGHPQLPAIHDSLIVPDDARMAVNVLGAEYHDVLGVDLLPWRGPIPRTLDPATVPFAFGPVYAQDAFFPASIVELGEPYVLHDVRGAVLTVAPFQYNPVQRVLRVYDAIEVEVLPVGTGGANVIDRASYGRRPDRTFHALYQSHFMNPGTYAVAPPPDVGDLLVISHGPFLGAIQPLVDWKLSQGQNVTLVDVATIGNTATAIKNHIAAVYAAGNLAFVLLVGDYPEIQSASYAGGLSDPSYSTMTADWYPDLFVGRFSAKTVAHVDTQVQRTLAYEQAPHDLSAGDWNAWGMGIASNQGLGIGHYGEGDWQHEDLIRDELLDYGFTKVDQIYDPTGTKVMVKNALNEGRRIVNYTGHGSSSSWGSTGFSSTDVAALSNMGHLPFICSVACVNGQFDLDTCFAEAWLRSTSGGQPIGAVATYMSSINQYWAEPMYAQGNHAKSGQLAACEHFWLEECGSVCGMWFSGSCTMMEICGTAGRDMFMTWNLFGDPSLHLYTASEPPTLVASGTEIPLGRPVDIALTVQPGVDYAAAKYFLLAGVSGTSPGFDLAGGAVHVPLQWDLLTYIVVANPNGWVFDGFQGTLDATGEATAVFDTTGYTPLDPVLAGLTMSLTAVVWHAGGPYELATNDVSLHFVP